MEYRRIQKRTAQRLVESGKDIYMIPCKVDIHKDTMIKIDTNLGFDDVVNKIEKTYCNTIIGRYMHYYIKVKE